PSPVNYTRCNRLTSPILLAPDGRHDGDRSSIRARLPARVQVVTLQVRRQLAGFRSQILLIDQSLLIDDERHDAAAAVFRRPGHDGKPTDHVSVDDVIVLAAGSVLALAGQDFEKVTVVRLRFCFTIPCLEAVTFTLCFGYQRTQRTDLAVGFH